MFGAAVMIRARLAAAAVGTLVPLLAAACSHTAAPGSGAPPSGVGGSEAAGVRSLFRVRYQGPAGSGSLRLALYLVTVDVYQLRATDPFGRAVWSLSMDAAGSRLVDYRSGRYCDSGREVRIPEVTLAPLPLDRLPEMLAGRLPVSPAKGEDPASGEFRDTAGRRWTAHLEAGTLERWTLWERGEPSLWWSRDGRGGVLSHRSGSQFRWRLSVTEPMAGPPPPLTPPEGFAAVECRRLWQAERAPPRERRSAGGDLTASPGAF